jgi:hypothetical protein
MLDQNLWARSAVFMNKPTKDADETRLDADSSPSASANPGPAASAKAERAARLAAALRANLRRRKAPGAGGARSPKESN